MLAQCEKHGHEGISLLPSLPLRDVLGDPQLVLPTNTYNEIQSPPGTA